MRLFLLFCISFPLLGLSQVDVKQLSYDATPGHKWEVGGHLGHMFTAGDIPFKPGFAGGIHVRRALDYIFSFRIDANYGMMRGERFNGDNQFKTNWFNTTFQGVISVNNLKWDEPNRRSNLYAYVGGGFNRFNVDQTAGNGRPGRNVDKATSPVVDIGGGFAIRLSDDVNIGVDHKFSSLFSRHADQIDGFENQGFRDMVSYTSIRLNFNLGKKDKAEPLYWVNPLSAIINDLTEIKERPPFVPTDTDGDGVLDILDLESNTPVGVPVDTRGITLDSDKDGIPNHKDAEPYSPPNFEYDENGVATQPRYVTAEEVDEKLKQQQEMLPWFLPNIHFRVNQAEIRSTEYPKLQHVAKILKLYENIHLAVIGYTDQQGSEQYNNLLSYGRAEAVIDYLVEQYNVDRDRVVLIWKGEEEAVVVDDEESYMNRRVEFKVVDASVQDMSKPKKNGTKRY